MNQITKVLINLGKKNHHLMTLMRKTNYMQHRARYLMSYAMNKVDDNVIVFESYLGRQYACSPRAIYEEMLKMDLDYQYIWIVRDVEAHRYLENNKNTKVVKFGSQAYYKAYARAKYIIVNSKKELDIRRRPQQTYIQCWHGTPLKKLGCDIETEEGNAMLNIDEIHQGYINDAKKYSYMISPSRFCSETFMSAFRIDDASIMIETGYPRNDFLLTYTDEDVRRIKQSLQLPEDKTIIFYAPTFRDNQHEAGRGYTYDLGLDIGDMREALGDQYIILLRTHYLVANQIDLKAYEGFIYNVCDYEDIRDLYVISDCLLTDYSSVFFDFANLKRPIYFYMYDLDAYKNDIRGFYIDLNTLPGPISTTQEALINDIKATDYQEKYHDRYDAFNATYNYLDDGHASERVIIDYILKQG